MQYLMTFDYIAWKRPDIKREKRKGRSITRIVNIQE